MLAEVADEESPDASAIPRILGASVVVGVLAGLAVIAYLSVEHALQGLLWDTIPDGLGGTPAWWVFAVLVVGAVGVWLALKLPGHGGHRPLDGLGIDIGPKQIGSVVAAALISLSIGAVVGPEAPLMAIGSAVGGFVAMRSTDPVRKVLMLAGAVAAITMILGNPMVSAVLVLEAAALKGSPGGKKVMLAVLPVLIALVVALVPFAWLVWRAASNLEGHVRAGAEIIAEALARRTRPAAVADVPPAPAMT